MLVAAACDSDLLADVVDLRFGAMLPRRGGKQQHEIRRRIDVVFEILSEIVRPAERSHPAVITHPAIPRAMTSRELMFIKMFIKLFDVRKLSDVNPV